MLSSCSDPFASPLFKQLPSTQRLKGDACPDKPWLSFYANLKPNTTLTVPLRAGDLFVLDGCYADSASLCETFCSLNSYLASQRHLAVWEIGLCLIGLLVLLATLIGLCALRQLPGGRLAAVHRQLLWAYCAYFLCRSGRLLSWPSVRCLGRDACLSLDALFELLEVLSYAGLFASFLAQSICLRRRLGRRHKPACQSPPRRKRQPLFELLSLAWPLPVVVATAHLVCRTLAPGQLAQLHKYSALYRPEPVSLYTASVRLPLAGAHLVSMVLGAQSLRLSLPPRQTCPGPARWARSLALISALTGAYLLLDLVPAGLAPSWLRHLQLAGHLLQSLLVTLPMFWLNRRHRRSARHRIRRGVTGAGANFRRQLFGNKFELAAAAVTGCKVVSFLPASSPTDRMGHLDCEIDS
ncbi:hypothetical protein BOX15_Mlig018784g2 [Macrostomum lignano]|uniref:Uncharacterized protein n=1 Tax=Macrostomum lignano TaxID=282301 RepID=A0A267EJL3_9PLAT|nr:hypothetical protein BOX15_Mlig018784g1 [Macrostomum lignano]PAA84580.1 hypothetical protein BOX15_Mlig018784g2 [Macrostomum lignano]